MRLYDDEECSYVSLVETRLGRLSARPASRIDLYRHIHLREVLLRSGLPV
jgi:hypothetical protein